MSNKEPLKIKFVKGTFDDFDGTQEELDELVNEITKFLKSDEFAEALANAPVSISEGLDSENWGEFEIDSSCWQSNFRTIH
jgi:hypothetical protein